MNTDIQVFFMFMDMIKNLKGEYKYIIFLDKENFEYIKNKFDSFFWSKNFITRANKCQSLYINPENNAEIRLIKYNSNCRGYKCHFALYDTNIPYDAVRSIIYPMVMKNTLFKVNACDFYEISYLL